MGAVGVAGLSGGQGGAGTTYTLGGVSYLLAGGGGGGTDDTSSSAGGTGGGGAGGIQSTSGIAATANTGGGGGGAGGTTAQSGGAGGSGIVIITYVVPSTGALTTGTVNVSGGYYVNGVQLTAGSIIAGSTGPGSLLTATGSSNGLYGNANLNFDGSTLTISNNAVAKGRITAFGSPTNTSSYAAVSPLAVINGGGNAVFIPQIEFQYYSFGGGYNHYIGSRHYGAATNVGNSIDFWLYSSASGAAASTAPGTGNVNTMSVTATGVGIFCNSPGYSLHVLGTSYMSSNLGVGVAPLATAGSVNVSEGFYINGVKQLGPTGATGPAGAGGGGGGGIVYGATATTGAVLTVTGGTGSFANSGLTYVNGILSLGNPTAGSAVAGSINAAAGFYSNGSLFSGGGGGGSTIAGSTVPGALLTATGSTSGLYGNANLIFNNGTFSTPSNTFLGFTGGSVAIGPNANLPTFTGLSVNGGLVLSNGFRPLYSNVSSGTSFTAGAYGTHYNITTSGITGITLGSGTAASVDSNVYWVFRNNTGVYLTITLTYTISGGGVNSLVIPPANSVTAMVVANSGGSAGVVFF